MDKRRGNVFICWPQFPFTRHAPSTFLVELIVESYRPLSLTMWKSSFQIYCAIFSLIHLASAGQQSRPGEQSQPVEQGNPGQQSQQPCAVLQDLPHHISQNDDALLNHQRAATAVWSKAYGDKDVDTMMSYVRQDYIQHNPNIKSGREIARKYITKRLSTPQLVNNITLVVSQLNFVLLHVHRINPGEKDRAMADIYRLDGTCIAEHWDVQQEMDSENPNPAAFFQWD